MRALIFLFASLSLLAALPASAAERGRIPCGSHSYILPKGFEARNYVHNPASSMMLNVPPFRHTTKEMDKSVVFCILEKNVDDTPFILDSKKELLWQSISKHNARLIIADTKTSDDGRYRLYALRNKTTNNPDDKGYYDIPLIELNARGHENHTLLLIRLHKRGMLHTDKALAERARKRAALVKKLEESIR